MPTKAQLQERIKRERELADSKYKELEITYQEVKDKLYSVNKRYAELETLCGGLRSQIRDLDKTILHTNYSVGEAQAYKYALELQHGLHRSSPLTPYGLEALNRHMAVVNGK